MNGKGQRFKGKSILVAEDVKVNQFLLKRILENEGVDVDLTDNGQEAIEKVKAGNYDLILMDIQMPKKDGWEATEAIRALDEPAKANIPIIALTAHNMPEETQRCLAVGMNDFITKPYKAEELYKKIASFLEGNYWRLSEQPLQSLLSSDHLYDLSLMQELNGSNGPFVKELVRLFIQSVPGEIEALRNAADNMDAREMSRIAHRLKSATQHLGVVSLVDIFEWLERLSEYPDPTMVHERIDLINNVLIRVIAQLESQEIGSSVA